MSTHAHPMDTRARLLAVLGLPENASLESARQAWRQQSRALHQAGLNARNTNTLATINAAWDMLRKGTYAPTTPTWDVRLHAPEYVFYALHTRARMALKALEGIETQVRARDKAAAVLGLPLAHLVQDTPRLVFHTAYRVRKDAAGTLTVVFPSRLEPGYNVLLFPAYNAQTPGLSGSAGVETAALLLDEAKARSPQARTATLPSYPGRVRMDFTGVLAAEVFLPQQPNPDFFHGLDPAAGAYAQDIARALQGRSRRIWHPMLRLLHALWPKRRTS